MALGRYLVEAHLREGRSVAELASTHGIHRSWLYKLLRRYREQGEAGLAPRSRRPHRSPQAMSTATAARIVRLRAQLLRAGFDGGAETIHAHLARRSSAVPSVSSIWRLLRRRGLVTPQPHKRPRSSFVRFVAALPNECWQADATHWRLRGGSSVEIVNVLDDHSRLFIASVALPVATAAAVAGIFASACRRYGAPAALLTDNGRVFSAEDRGWTVALASELARGGIAHKRARPYHPQTCGKVERLHQSLKRYLLRQPRARSLELLQRQLDRFVRYYNIERPHRALGRRTPAEIYAAKVKATPHRAPEGAVQFRIRHDRVDAHGKLTLRLDSRLHHIGIGRRLQGQEVVLLIADRDVRIVTPDGTLVRHLRLDPKRDYQPQSLDVAV
jgi:transposase InsO family protein